jgi:hypothetical protein
MYDNEEMKVVARLKTEADNADTLQGVVLPGSGP